MVRGTNQKALQHNGSAPRLPRNRRTFTGPCAVPSGGTHRLGQFSRPLLLSEMQNVTDLGSRTWFFMVQSKYWPRANPLLIYNRSSFLLQRNTWTRIYHLMVVVWSFLSLQSTGSVAWVWCASITARLGREWSKYGRRGWGCLIEGSSLHSRSNPEWRVGFRWSAKPRVCLVRFGIEVDWSWYRRNQSRLYHLDRVAHTNVLGLPRRGPGLGSIQRCW